MNVWVHVCEYMYVSECACTCTNICELVISKFQSLQCLFSVIHDEYWVDLGCVFCSTGIFLLLSPSYKEEFIKLQHTNPIPLLVMMYMYCKLWVCLKEIFWWLSMFSFQSTNLNTERKIICYMYMYCTLLRSTVHEHVFFLFHQIKCCMHVTVSSSVWL